MGVYTRYKRDSEGFRQLIELLETTPASRRKKMIDIGMKEDPEYTEKALQYVLTFADIIQLPDLELAEVLSETPPRFAAYAIHNADQKVKDRFVSKAQPRASIEIREFLETPNVTSIQIGGAQMKMIEVTRKLEKKGLLTIKRIPNSG